MLKDWNPAGGIEDIIPAPYMLIRDESSYPDMPYIGAETLEKGYPPAAAAPAPAEGLAVEAAIEAVPGGRGAPVADAAVVEGAAA